MTTREKVSFAIGLLLAVERILANTNEANPDVILQSITDAKELIKESLELE